MCKINLCCRTSLGWTGIVLAGLLAYVAPAHAQGVTTATRPFRGTFGGSNPNGSSGGGLNATITLAEAYDGDVTGQSSGGNLGGAQPVGGYFSVALIDLAYTRNTPRFELFATSETTASYYPQQDDLFGTRLGGTVGFMATLGSFRFGLDQSVDYNPFYSFMVVPSPSVRDDETFTTAHSSVADLNVISRKSWNYQTVFSAAKQLTTRTSLEGRGGWRKSDFESGAADLTQSSGAIHLRRNFTRYLTLAMGYGYETGRSATGASEIGLQRRPTHRIDLGTDYARPLSRTRRTMLTFSSGTSGVTAATGERVFRLTGRAGLSHQMGRTWSVRVDYDRAVRYQEGFAAPLFSDAGVARFRGFLTDSLDLTGEVAVSDGTVGVATGAPRFFSYWSTTNLRFGVNRSLALYGQYTYYHYDFEQQTILPGIPRQFDRNAASVGVTIWLPIMSDRGKKR